MMSPRLRRGGGSGHARTALALLRVGMVGCLGQGAISPDAAASSPPPSAGSGAPAPPTSPPPPSSGGGAGTPASMPSSSPLPPSRPPLPSGAQGSSPDGDGAASPAAAPGEPGAPASVAAGGVTRDAMSFESDHEAVLLGWGIAVTPLATQLPVFTLRSSTGCPLPASAASPPDCPAVNVSAIDVRRWMARAWAVDAGLAFALGGGRDHGRLLDTYFAAGPRLGVAVLLASWRHMAVMASPAVSVVFFRPAGSAGTASVVDVDANLEAEIHFGFWGLPALSLGLRSGLGLRLEHASEVTRWSVGPAGITTLARAVNDLSLRYYF